VRLTISLKIKLGRNAWTTFKTDRGESSVYIIGHPVGIVTQVYPEAIHFQPRIIRPRGVPIQLYMLGRDCLCGACCFWRFGNKKENEKW
jgi:hypothetical protein